MKWLSPLLNIQSEEYKRRGYFRIYNVTNDFPRYQDGEWNLTIDGLVTEPMTLSMGELKQMKWDTIIDDFHCVTGWSVKGVELKGVYVKNVFDKFGIIPNNSFVTAYSGDEVYFDTFKLSQLMEEDAMLVFELDGEPLKYSQGYPCRLYQPNMYGFKSVKWLTRLEATENREYGYWQQNGDYDLDGYL
jgi:DMSO/TMAO reductase YedYZ molybdopterin-dependent catalytic subunit